MLYVRLIFLGVSGEVGGIYPSAILAVLPRLLTAAVPPGSSSQENRRQCMKVSDVASVMILDLPSIATFPNPFLFVMVDSFRFLTYQ